MIIFSQSLAAWNTPVFTSVFKQEVCRLEKDALPLQTALAHSSHVSDGAIDPVVLTINEVQDAIHIKTGVFYSGIIAGSCCADDPTPVCEQTEYCELMISINKTSAEVSIVLLSDDHDRMG